MRVKAAGRYIFYRQPSGVWPYLMLPSVSMTTFLVVTLVFLTALVFTQQPYYRQHLGFGICLRSYSHCSGWESKRCYLVHWYQSRKAERSTSIGSVDEFWLESSPFDSILHRFLPRLWK